MHITKEYWKGFHHRIHPNVTAKECCGIEQNPTENARDERDEERNENDAQEHKCSYELVPWDDDPSKKNGRY
jgi:hypothetical protein